MRNLNLNKVFVNTGISIFLSWFSINSILPTLAVQSLQRTGLYENIDKHPKSDSLKTNTRERILIAASPQLNNLLYNLSYRVTSIARYYSVPARDFDQAYYIAYQEFYKIIDPNTIGSPIWSNTAGWIYTASLRGGGTSNLRQYGASIPLMPTIDILNHNTPSFAGQTFSQVREVKFPYNAPLYCPASTTSPC